MHEILNLALGTYINKSIYKLNFTYIAPFKTTACPFKDLKN